MVDSYQGKEEEGSRGGVGSTIEPSTDGDVNMETLT